MVHSDAHEKKILTGKIRIFSNVKTYVIHQAIVKSNGEINYEVPEKIEVFCALNVQAFPFDEQFCDLYLCSWMYTAEQLEILQSEVDGMEFMKDNAGKTFSLI